MNKHTRKIFLIVKAAVSAAFFFILITFIQGNELISVFAGVDWFFFTLSFILAIVMLLISCLKWKYLLDATGHRLNYLLLLRTYFIGYFFSNLLPSTVGGDLIRSYSIGRLIDNQASAATSVFLERFTGMIFLLLLVLIAPLLQPELYKSPFIYVPAFGAALLLLLVVWMLKVKEPLALPEKILALVLTSFNQWALKVKIKPLQRLATWLKRIYAGMLKRLRKFNTELQTSIVEIQNNKWLFLRLFILTALFYLLTWINVYISFLAFGVTPGFISISSLVPTIMFVSQIPLTFLGNLGFVESVFVFYFMYLKIPAAASLAMGLLLRVKMLWLGLIGFFIYLLLSSGNKSDLVQVSRINSKLSSERTKKC